MEPAANDLAEILGLSDLHVCLLREDGARVYVSDALVSWLEADPSALDREGRIARDGRLWDIQHLTLASGLEARVVRPVHAAHALLLERSRILEALVEAAPVAILALDLEMRVTMWNPACERIFGWSADEVMGTPYPLVPEDEWTRFEGFFQTVIDGKGFTGVEAERARKDGRRIHIVISTAPIASAGGEVIGAMAILEDVTERKLLEARYRQAAKLEAIGRLAGGVAHDFNNILTVILAYSETLVTEEDPGLIRSGAESIRRSAERAAELTRQLLAFSRRQVLKARVVDLNEVVGESLDMLGRLIGADIAVTTQFARRPAWVRADPTQVEQLLMNLAANARDAMPQGGRLALSTDHVFRDQERWVQLSVTDSGQGMDPDTASRVFEPFFTTKPKGKGTGLGLASVYGIVRQSGGEVDVVSYEGVGTTFRILLPASEPPAERVAAARGPLATTRSATVLVAEDDASVRMVLTAMLRTLGHTVLEAEDGVRALEIAAAHDGHIDVLLTDVVMPRMGGGELAQRMAAARPATRILFASGYADDEVVRRGAERGAHFLQKPFTVAGIRDAMQRVLDS